MFRVTRKKRYNISMRRGFVAVYNYNFLTQHFLTHMPSTKTGLTSDTSNFHSPKAIESAGCKLFLNSPALSKTETMRKESTHNGIKTNHAQKVRGRKKN